MNAGEALDNDRPSPQVPGLQRRVLSAAALAVILVADHAPLDAVRLQ